MATENKRMRQLIALESEWQTTNPVILEGELAMSSDVEKFKVGPGRWSTLTYWEAGSGLGDAPTDGFVYGAKDGVWTRAPEYEDGYVGDLDLITDSHVKFVHLAGSNTNGWAGMIAGDYVMHLSDPASGHAVQMGYHYSAEGLGQSVLHMRVQRGAWTDWFTVPIFSEESYIGSLTELANSSLPYNATVYVGVGVSGGWTDISPGDIVQVVNIDADSAQMIGFSTGATQAEMEMWLRRKEGGNWGPWNRPQVMMDDITNLDVYTPQEIHDLFVDISGDTMTGYLFLHADPTLDGHAANKGYVDGLHESQDFINLVDTPSSYITAQRKFVRTNDIATPTALEFADIIEQDIADLDRVRWNTPYVFGTTYENNDMVLDGDWTMVANKTTTDRAAPQADDNLTYDMVDIPGFLEQSFAGVVQSGRAWTNTEVITLVGYQVWIPTVTDDTKYTIQLFTYPEGQQDKLKYTAVDNPILNEDAWTTIGVSQTLIAAGTVFGIVVAALNSGSSTIVTGGWTREANSNTLGNDPGNAGWGTSNSDNNLRINYTDADSVNRKTELTDIVVGSVIQFVNTANPAQSMIWTINGAGVDQGTHISFANVTYDGEGAAGVPAVGTQTTMTADIPVASPTNYAILDLGNPTHTWGTSIGMLEFDGVAQVGADLDAFGVRVLTDTWTKSDDWEVAGLIGTSGVAGSGTEGGVTKFIDLIDTPGSYLNNQGKIPIVNQVEDALEWYVPGSIMSLPILTDITKGDAAGGVAPDQAAIALNNTDYATFVGNAPNFGWSQEQSETGMVRIDPQNAVYIGFDSVLYTYIGPRKVYVGLDVGDVHVPGVGYEDYSEYVMQSVDLVAITTSHHTLLAGLDQDDHPQYLTTGRGDARYLPTTGGTMTGNATWIVGTDKVVIGAEGVAWTNTSNQYGGIISADVPATMGSTWNLTPNDLNNVLEDWHRLYFDADAGKWGIRQGTTIADNAADLAVDEIMTAGLLTDTYLPLTGGDLSGRLVIAPTGAVTNPLRLMRATGLQTRITFDVDTVANEAAYIEWDEPNKQFDFHTTANGNIARIEADPLVAAATEYTLMTRSKGDLRYVEVNGDDQVVGSRFFVFDGSQALTLGGSYIQFPPEVILNLPQNDGSFNFNANRGLMVWRETQPGEQTGVGAYTVLDTANISSSGGIIITGHDAGEEGVTAINFAFDEASAGLDARYVEVAGDTMTGGLTITGGALLLDRMGEATSALVTLSSDVGHRAGYRLQSDDGTSRNVMLKEADGNFRLGNSNWPALQTLVGAFQTESRLVSLDLAVDMPGVEYYLTGGMGDARYLELAGGTMTGQIVLANVEPSVLAIDGEFGFDASRGLIIYRDQTIGDEAVVGGFTVLDGSNIAATGGITIINTDAAQAASNPITFGFDPAAAGGPWLPLSMGMLTNSGTTTNYAVMFQNTNATTGFTAIRARTNGELSFYSDIGGVSDEIARLELSSATLGDAHSIVTREKGDARYMRSGGAPLVVATFNTLTASGKQTVNHGLSYTPIMFSAHLVCITADGVWAVGDRADLPNHYIGDNEGAGQYYGAQVASNATQIILKLAAWAGGASVNLVLLNDSGIPTIITGANWKIEVSIYG